MRWMLAATLLAQSAWPVSLFLDSLQGAWDDPESFVSLEQCAAAPAEARLYRCSPAQVAAFEGSRFEAAGFVSGTESVLNVADALRQSHIDSAQISELFSKYNYSDFFVGGRINYVTKGFIVGVRPIRQSGQFSFHNPSLPLGSMSYRNDLGVFGGSARSFTLGPVALEVGFSVDFAYRSEVLAEATLVDFVSKPPEEIVIPRETGGIFADAGLVARLPRDLTLALTARDLGGFFKGTTARQDSLLFVVPDRNARLFATLAWNPPLGYGRLQLSTAGLGFFSRANEWSDQIVGGIGYYVGPFHFASVIHPRLFRTGIVLRFERFEASVAQEWVNSLSLGRNTQPRIVFGVVAGL